MKLETFILLLYAFILILMSTHYHYIITSVANGRMELQQVRKEMFILHEEQLKNPDIHKKIKESLWEDKIK